MNKPSTMEKALLSNGTSQFIIPSIIVRPSTGTGTLASRGSKFLMNFKSLHNNVWKKKMSMLGKEESWQRRSLFSRLPISLFWEKKTFVSPLFDLAFRFERNPCVHHKGWIQEMNPVVLKKINFGYVCSENKLQKEALFYFLILGISKVAATRNSWLSPHFS